MERSVMLLLALDLEADPIGGTITDEGEVVRPFHGWLQLTEAIEGARLAGSPDSSRACTESERGSAPRVDGG